MSEPFLRFLTLLTQGVILFEHPLHVGRVRAGSARRCGFQRRVPIPVPQRVWRWWFPGVSARSEAAAAVKPSLNQINNNNNKLLRLLLHSQASKFPPPWRHRGLYHSAAQRRVGVKRKLLVYSRYWFRKYEALFNNFYYLLSAFINHRTLCFSWQYIPSAGVTPAIRCFFAHSFAR